MLLQRFLGVGVALFSLGTGVSAGDCKCGPKDRCWPSESDWDNLNKTVNGRLIKTIPIGYVCHDPTYNEAACNELQQTWDLAETHLVNPSSIMQAYWANFSCSPFTATSKKCHVGDYVRYTINVTSEQDIIAGIHFAQQKNIRLVVKNTGHDQTGRSTGYGALGLWTHYIKGPQINTNYKGNGYSGPAVKLMAGDEVEEVLTYLQGLGYLAVGGTCPTVGVAGGYTPGGGHSTLATLFGLGADQTLEFELITAKGQIVRASPTQNEDLYWAMSGGGPFTYAIVWSITVKIHKDFQVGAASISMNIGNNTEDEFWQIVDTWHTIVPSVNAASAYAYAYYIKGHFQILPLLAHNMTAAQAGALLSPLKAKMDSLGFQYNFTTTQYSTYNDAYNNAFPPWTVGGIQLGSRLIPRDVVENNQKGLSTAIRTIFDDGALIVEAIMNPNLTVAGKPDNSVLPAWRPSIIDLVIGAPWNNTASRAFDEAQQTTITNVWMPLLKAITPGSGCYMNEGDPNDPDWKEDFFGSNYQKLLGIKRKWDPDYFFYALKTVGSDVWGENSEQVLCRT